MPDLRVAVVGPESSGKTTLVEHLRMWLQQRGLLVVVVPDQGRILAERLPPGHPWTYQDQQATLLMQIGAEAAAEAELRALTSPGVLIADGSAATPAVWHLCAVRNRPTYVAGPDHVMQDLLRAASEDRFDVILLLAPDLPWEADGIREDPGGRDEALEEYRKIYPRAHVISGTEREQDAVAILEEALTISR